MTRTLFFLAFCASGQAQLAGVGVRSAASRIGGAVAPGSFMAVFSTSLPPRIFSVADSVIELTTADGKLFNLPLRPPPTDSGEMWAVVPKDAVTGTAAGTLFERGGRAGNFSIRIEAVAPGIFTADYSGVGPALALNYVGSVPTRNALTSAAVPERFVALFATGLNDAKAADVSVEIAGQSAPATYAGPQGTPDSTKSISWCRKARTWAATCRSRCACEACSAMMPRSPSTPTRTLARILWA